MVNSIEGRRSDQRRRGRFRRAVRVALRVLGAVALLLLILYAIAPPFILPTVVRRLGLPELETAFGGRVRVDRITVGYLGEVTLIGVTVEGVGDSEPLIEAPRVTVGPDLGALLRGRIQFEYVIADEALLRVTRRTDGSTTLDPLIEGTAQVWWASGTGDAAGPDEAVRVHRCRIRRGRLLLSDERSGFTAEVTDLDLAGSVDGVAGRVILSATGGASDGQTPVGFDLWAGTPGVDPGAVRIRLDWQDRGRTSSLLIPGLSAASGGEVTLDLPSDGSVRLRGKAIFQDARVTPDAPVLAHGQAGGAASTGQPSPKAASPPPVRQPLRGALPAAEAAWVEVRPDITFDPASVEASLAGRVAVAWRDVRADSRRKNRGHKSWVCVPGFSTGFSSGRADVTFARGGLERVVGTATARDLVLIDKSTPEQPVSRLTVPEADVGLDLSFSSDRPTGVVDVRVAGCDVEEILNVLERRGVVERVPSVSGSLRYACRAAVERDGRLTVSGTGRIDPVRIGPPVSEGEGARSDAIVEFDHVVRLGGDTAPLRRAQGVLNYRLTGVPVGPVLCEVSRLWPAVRLGEMPVAGRLEAWGVARLECDTEGRRVVLRARGALNEPRLANRVLCPARRAVVARLDLVAGLDRRRISGSVHAAAQDVDLSAALAAVGADALARRWDGALNARCTVAVETGRPVRIEADVTGTRVSLLGGASEPVELGPVHVAAAVEVDGAAARIDLADASVRLPGLTGRAAGRLERDRAGVWTGGVNARAQIDAGRLLAHLRRAGLAPPPALDVRGDVPVEWRLTTARSGQRLEGSLRLAETGAVSFGDLLCVPAGTPATVGFALARPAGSKVVEVKDVSAALPGVSAALRGVVDLGGDTLDVRVEATVTDAGRAGALCPALAAARPAGAARAAGRLTGAIAAPRFSGAVFLEDLSGAAAAEGVGRLSVTGAITVEDRRGTFDTLRVIWHGEPLAVTGTVDLTAGRRPSAVLRVTGASLRLDDWPDSDPAGGAPGWVGRLRDVDAVVTATIDRLDLGLLVVDKAAGTAVLEDGRVRVDPAVGFVEGGAVTATGVIGLADTVPALTLTVNGTGIRTEGRIRDVLGEHLPVLRLYGGSDVTGTLTFPLTPDPARPWPTGRLRLICHDGSLHGPTSPDWLLRRFHNLHLDRYPFRVMAVDVRCQDGKRAKVVAFFESETVVDMVAEAHVTSAGTLRLDASVDLLASANPAPALFKAERPYAVRVYRLQEAWVEGKRVLHAGGFRSATEVSLDVMVRRNALVQELGKAGGELGRIGLKMLDQFVPVRAMDELLRGLRRAEEKD